MWDFIKNILISFWPELLIIGLVGFCFVALLVVARLEKHFLNQFVPVAPGELPPASPYFQAMNAAAPSLGYVFCGNLVQSRSSSLYKCCLALWVSTSQNTLLVIGGGKLAKMDYKRTSLISVVSDEKALVTMDDFGMCDLSGIRAIEVVFNADLNELHALHSQRLDSLSSAPRPFSAELVCQQYKDLERLRVQKMVLLGLAEFLDSSQECWRYNFKGAWKSAYEGYLKGLKNAKAQSARMKIKRPGS